MISPDLPFHGATDWNEEAFEISDIYAIVQQIIETEGFAKRKLHILGYSVGGRVALSFLEHYATQVSSLTLVAPDGFYRNPWYRFAAQTIVGNKLFRATVDKPNWFVRLLSISRKFGMVSESNHKFVEYFFQDQVMRTSLYNRWRILRHFKPGLKNIRSLIVSERVKVRMLFGDQDYIIRYKPGMYFAQTSAGDIEAKVVHAGHQLLQSRYSTEIIDMLFS